jgi:hypothetical protein
MSKNKNKPTNPNPFDSIFDLLDTNIDKLIHWSNPQGNDVMNFERNPWIDKSKIEINKKPKN